MKLKITILSLFMGVQTFAIAQVNFDATAVAFGTVDSGTTNSFMVTMQISSGSAGTVSVSGGIQNYTPPKTFENCGLVASQPAYTSTQIGGDKNGKLTEIKPIMFTIYFLPIAYQHSGPTSAGSKNNCDSTYTTNGGGDYTANFWVQYNGFVDGKQINSDRFLAITGKSRTIGTDPQQTTRVYEVKVQDYSIYPNPTNNEVNIKVASEQTVRLVNALGTIIKTFKVTDSYQLSLADLPAGIYSLVGETFQEKIQKI